MEFRPFPLDSDLPVHRGAEPPHRLQGDARNLGQHCLRPVDLVVTSPPYWRRRNYGHEGQLGQEETPEAFANALVGAMEGWVTLLTPHASVFVNLGDTHVDGGLAGAPALFEIAARQAGWRVVNHIVWTKATGVPQPRSYRLASRHESVFHLARAASSALYVDRIALAEHLGTAASPGDAWSIPGEPAVVADAVVSDVWPLAPSPAKKGHPAPFPPELVRRLLHFAAPPRVCNLCSEPFRRVVAHDFEANPARPQSMRARERFREAGLTEAHLAAIRAVGISDAGFGKRLQTGSGRNRTDVQRLADEAKAALGGYFREFTFGPKRTVGWEGCTCGVPTRPGHVFDPFAGSGTTLRTAFDMGFDATGLDLAPHTP